LVATVILQLETFGVCSIALHIRQKGRKKKNKKAIEGVYKVISRRMQSQTNIEDEYSEGISRLFSALIAHSRANIVSASLAHHLL